MSGGVNEFLEACERRWHVHAGAKAPLEQFGEIFRHGFVSRLKKRLRRWGIITTLPDSRQFGVSHPRERL